MSVRRAVVLVSGGLDSATALAIAAAEGFELHAISFDYGQRHRFELEAADRVCLAQKVSSRVVFHIDTTIFRGSALTNDIPVPHHRNEEQMSAGIPVTEQSLGTLHLQRPRGTNWEIWADSEDFYGLDAMT